jgi:hypothetical protein
LPRRALMALSARLAMTDAELVNSLRLHPVAFLFTWTGSKFIAIHLIQYNLVFRPFCSTIPSSF